MKNPQSIFELNVAILKAKIQNDKVFVHVVKTFQHENTALTDCLTQLI